MPRKGGYLILTKQDFNLLKIGFGSPPISISFASHENQVLSVHGLIKIFDRLRYLLVFTGVSTLAYTYLHYSLNIQSCSICFLRLVSKLAKFCSWRFSKGTLGTLKTIP